MELPPSTAPNLRGLLKQRVRCALHIDPCLLIQRSRVDCRDQCRILRFWKVRAKSIHIDQSFCNNDTRNANAPFDMIDRHTVQIELPTASDIAAQGKATAIRDERACFVDPAAYC